MNEQEQFWAGEFGDDYIKRNQVDWRARIPFWREVIDFTGPRSVHEFGCNAGWNLSAIKMTGRAIMATGNDINQKAIDIARSAGLRCWHEGQINVKAELVFTSGVLIHVAPDDLQPIMQKIIDASYRWVIAVEYSDNEEVEVEYRGHAGKLWRRPFGKLYQDMGLKLVREWDAGHAFDRCTAWLLEKQ